MDLMFSHFVSKDTLDSGIPVVLLWAASVVFVCFLVEVNSRRAGLSHIPGPLLARYTNVWSLYVAWRTNLKHNRVGFQRQLQARYGDVIRIGPRTLLVMDPAAVPVIYGVRSRLNKGDAYLPLRLGDVKTNLVSIHDEKTHSQYRKLVSNAYSMTSLKGYEPNVDEILNRFVEVCDEHARRKIPMNISRWCQYYCFDVVTKLTLGSAFGFLDDKDVYGLIKGVKRLGFYAELVSQMPWLHKIFQDNPLLRRTRPSLFVGVVKQAVQDRIRHPDPEDQPRPDLLSHFVATHAEYPSLMDPQQVAIFASGNMAAGGLSPGKTFDNLCRYLATHPESQDRLNAEIQAAQCPSSSPVSYDQARSLPYLEGTIREGFRFNNAAVTNLQRVTGEGGLTLPNGCHVPPNTNIGCPGSAINQDPRVFGADADLFRPERWMQGEAETHEAYLDRRRVMEKSDMTFGHGSRSCIGRNIAALEFFKAVATLMAQFKFELVGQPKKGEVNVLVHRRAESQEGE